MFVVKTRSTNAIVGHAQDVAEALIMDAAGFRVDGVGYLAIVELAEARVKARPDWDQLPVKEERYAIYTSRKGNKMVVEIVRLTCPDSEGYAQYAEVINTKHPDGSFIAPAASLEIIDLSKMTPELANALIQGETYEQDGGGNTPKLTRGLRRKPE